MVGVCGCVGCVVGGVLRESRNVKFFKRRRVGVGGCTRLWKQRSCRGAVCVAYFFFFFFFFFIFFIFGRGSLTVVAVVVVVVVGVVDPVPRWFCFACFACLPAGLPACLPSFLPAPGAGAGCFATPWDPVSLSPAFVFVPARPSHPRPATVNDYDNDVVWGDLFLILFPFFYPFPHRHVGFSLRGYDADGSVEQSSTKYLATLLYFLIQEKEGRKDPQVNRCCAKRGGGGGKKKGKHTHSTPAPCSSIIHRSDANTQTSRRLCA